MPTARSRSGLARASSQGMPNQALQQTRTACRFLEVRSSLVRAGQVSLIDYDAAVTYSASSVFLVAIRTLEDSGTKGTFYIS